VVVVALDPLGRSRSGVIRTIETLIDAGVLLKSLREAIDYSTATGRMPAGIVNGQWSSRAERRRSPDVAEHHLPPPKSPAA